MMQTAPSLDAVDETSTLATFDAAAALADPLPADVLRSNSGFVVRTLNMCSWRKLPWVSSCGLWPFSLEARPGALSWSDSALCRLCTNIRKCSHHHLWLEFRSPG